MADARPMHTVLITGIAGLIGSRFAQWLLDYTDDYVVGIDDLSCGLRSNIPRGVEWRQLSLGRQHSYSVFAQHKPDVVYHFAAYAAECLSPFVRCYNYQSNLVATAEVVNACLRYGVRRLVFASSAAVYGTGRPPFQEDDAPRPMDPYGVAKLACEHDIRIAGEQHGLDWCVLRPHNVYGPGQSPWQRYRNVFGIWMDRHLRGLPLQIYGDGQQRRAFTCVDDILRPLYAAGFGRAASRQTINIGGAEPLSVIDAARVLVGVMGAGEIEHVSGRHEARDCWSTTDLSAAVLGWVDSTPLDRGLSAMWDWARTVPREEPRLPAIELADGLPAYWVEGTPATSQPPPVAPSR